MLENRFPSGGGYYSVVVGCSTHGMTAESRQAVIAKVEASMTPPTHEQAENWLAALQAACTSGKRSEAGAELALEMYAGAICRYPADIARKVCMDMALRHPKKGEPNWFPTLGEIDQALAKHAAPRQAMLQAVRGA